VTRNDRDWVRGYLRFRVSCSLALGLPPRVRADDFLYWLRDHLLGLECDLRAGDREAMRAAWDAAGIPRDVQAKFWTNQRAEAARLRRVLRDPVLPRLLERWERRQVFTDPQRG
jgi:hypothetical protein